MQISSDQIKFFVQVLKDSMNVDRAYAWVFKHSGAERQKFYNEFIEIMVDNLRFDIKEKD